AFLYLVPNYELLYGLIAAFRGTKQFVMFGLVDEFKREKLSTRVCDANHKESALHDALAKLLSAKTGN
ncbi:MAG TPA: hypothetical protein VEI49_06940, partial [Terriglobales bacterium]|nr:hypothetical protein [Terriglobales bacterium]